MEDNMSVANSVLGKSAHLEGIMTSIQNAVNLTDYEISVLSNIVDTMNRPLPSTVASSQRRVESLDKCRVDLLNLLFIVNSKFVDVESEYKRVYEPEFVRLTRAGRPNQSAVDSEIHLNADMSAKRVVLNNYEAVKGLLYGYLKTIDTVKSSCMRRWNDSF